MKSVFSSKSALRGILAGLTLMMFVFPSIVSGKTVIKAAQSNSETHPVGIGLINFAKRVQEMTGGEVEVKLFR